MTFEYTLSLLILVLAKYILIIKVAFLSCTVFLIYRTYAPKQT